MALDIVEEANGSRFRIWGTTQHGASVLSTVSDFEPYFYIAAPKRCDPSCSGAFDVEETETGIDWGREPRVLDTLCSILNRSAPVDSQIQRIEAVTRRPILYYRPDSPKEGDTYLKVILAPGGNVRRAGSQVLRSITNRPGLRSQGFVWKDQTIYEHEVNPLQRFLADLPCSGGAWLLIPPLNSSGGGSGGAVTTPLKGSESGPSTSKPTTVNTATTISTTPNTTTTTTAQHQPCGGYALSFGQQKISTADIEVVAPWKSIICLTPDATQLADTNWSPFTTNSVRSAISPSPAAVHAALIARRGEIAPIRLMVMDVCSATRDGKERAPVATQGDPIVAISCTLILQKQSASHAAAADEEKGKEEAAALINLTGLEDNDTAGEEQEEEVDDGSGGGGSAKVVAPSAAAVLGGPRSAAQRSAVAVKSKKGGPRPVVFLFCPSLSHPRNVHPSTTHTKTTTSAEKRHKTEEKLTSSLQERNSGAEIVLCSSEAELLLTWQHYIMGMDPDVIALFQVGNTLETISQRFQALNLTSSYSSSGSGGGRSSGGGLQLSRFLPQHAKSSISIKRITMYSAAWVRSQSRMSSTSNQETFKADIDGRLVVDILRQVLTSQNLASFSLVDCIQSILGETIEVLGAHKVASLAGITSASTSTAIEKEEKEKVEANAVRLARYTLRRTAAVHDLLNQLATIVEAIEMARATGLTIGQVMYNAQMVRTWSLLLRVGQYQNIIISSRPDSSTPLSEHTFILHPVEQRKYLRIISIINMFSFFLSSLKSCKVSYNAQMIRSYSLILRVAATLKIVVAGRQNSLSLAESPFLIHPVENGTLRNTLFQHFFFSSTTVEKLQVPLGSTKTLSLSLILRLFTRLFTVHTISATLPWSTKTMRKLWRQSTSRELPPVSASSSLRFVRAFYLLS
jgi:DNA polymerase delta subunit 1